MRDDDKLEYYLVVVDGRRIDSKGFCHDDESEFLFEKGCYIAYNLDGGGSSEMMFDGKIPKGTKFLFTSLNDKVSAKNMRIIALYNDSPNQLIAEKDLDATPKVLGGGK